jgi:hypothetical protein
VLDARADVLKESCEHCDPQHERFRDPSDRRLWDSYEVEPDRYYPKDSNGVARAKDELVQDTLDGLNNNGKSDDEWMIAKRKNRRTEPLSPEEIRATENFVREHLIPQIERAKLNEQYQHQE